MHSVGGSTDEAAVIYNVEEIKRLVISLYEGIERRVACDFTNKKHLRMCLTLEGQWRYPLQVNVT